MLKFREHYYDPSTKMGFIQYTLQNIQKKLPVEKKRYRKTTKKSKNDTDKLVLLSDDQLAEKVSKLINFQYIYLILIFFMIVNHSEILP